MALNRNDTNRREEPSDPALERIYALGEREEPPARLDDAIRAAARREVGARPYLPGRTWRAWRVPVSLAAVLVLSVSVVILMRQEGADRLDHVAPPTAPVESARPAQPAEPPAKGESLQRAEPAREAASRLRDAPVPETVRAVEEDRRKAQTGASADTVQPAAGPPSSAPQPFAEPQATPSESRVAAPPPAIRPQVGALSKEAESGAAAGAAVPKRSAPVPQAAPETRAPAAADLATQAKPYMEKRLRSENAAEVSRPIWSGYERQSPEKWIERIEELRRSGNEAGAREMLEEFRKRFPEHPVPAALAR